MEDTITAIDESNIEEITREVEGSVQKEQALYGVDNVVPMTPATNDVLTELKANEVGDAWLFARLQKNGFCFDRSLNKWFKWNGHCWEEDILGHVYTAIDSVVDKYSAEYDQQSWKRKSAILRQNTDEAKKAAEVWNKLGLDLSRCQCVCQLDYADMTG
jgi:hypothetical protein